MTQWITIAKLGGISAELVLRRFREWSAARTTDDPNEWSAEQWPDGVRQQADKFVIQLRAHAVAPPIVHFVEWVDMWSGLTCS